MMYVVKIKYVQPKEFFGMILTGDTVVFDNENELISFMESETAYDYLDNSVRKHEDEIVDEVIEMTKEDYYKYFTI